MFEEHNTEYGLCFTFNGSKEQQKKSRRQGSSGGLRVFFDVEQDKNFFSFTKQAGIKVCLLLFYVYLFLTF